MYTVKWFQILLCITNNSIKHQSFVYIQLNDQTVLFQTIQFSMSTKINYSKYCHVSLTIQLNISHLFTQLNIKTVLFQAIQFSISIRFQYQVFLFDPQIGPYQVLLFWIRVDLGVMTIKGYSTFHKAPALLEAHHQIVI